MVENVSELFGAYEKLPFLYEETLNVLTICDGEPKEVLVDTLLRDLRKELLLKERENMFEVARKKLQAVLQSESVLHDSQELNIKCRKRTERNIISVIAEELLDLVDYSAGYNDEFPQNTVSASSKMPHFVPTEIEGKTTEEVTEVRNIKEKIESGMPVADNLQSGDLYNIVLDLQVKLKMYEKDNKGMASRITRLENEMAILSQKSLVNAVCTHQHLYDCKEESKPTDVQIKNASSKIKEDVFDGRLIIERMPTTMKQNKAADEEVQNLLVKDPTIITRSQTYASALENGKKNEDVFQLQKKSKQSGKKNITMGVQQTSGKVCMQGARPLVPVYLRNIQVNSDDTDMQIGHMVAQYAKTKGIKVKNFHIIRNRNYEGVIGCKIMISEDVEELALNSDTWPQHVFCKKWMRTEIWKKIRYQKK